MTREKIEVCLSNMINNYIKIELPDNFENFIDGPGVKQIFSRPLIKFTELNESIENETIKDVLIKLGNEVSESMIKVFKEEGYSKYSKTFIVSADKPEEMKYGWVVYCNCK